MAIVYNIVSAFNAIARQIPFSHGVPGRCRRVVKLHASF